MTVLTYTAHEKVDATGSYNLCLVCRTLGSEVLRISVKDVDVFLRNVYMVEEIPCHETGSEKTSEKQ